MLLAKGFFYQKDLQAESNDCIPALLLKSVLENHS